MSYTFIADHAMLALLLVSLFVFGTIVGSLLNVCIYRLPMEKSILWPGSRCGHCLQPIRLYDNIPLVSYLMLRGRCRTCGTRFSIRYFFIELLTGLVFVGLFYLEVVQNIHGFPILAGQRDLMQRLLLPSGPAWVVFGHHALLVSLLIVASFTDLDHREIPLGITVPGTIFGVLAATLWPWPWPWTPAEAVAHMPHGEPWWIVNPILGPEQGLYPWPFWGPLPGWFAPGGNWQTGLATGLIGAGAGAMLVRVIRRLFGWGFGEEGLGLGDADLMMMAGSFMGWQPVVVAFFVGVCIGLIPALAQRLFRHERMVPFGPFLALGIIVTLLTWRFNVRGGIYGIAPSVQALFFCWWLMLLCIGLMAVLLPVVSYFLRLMRGA
jgi:leader peptidase (prepilin peptidase) / N-methyltransferase